MQELLIVFAAALGIGVISGISGGGGGMLMIPLYIFLGLSAPQAVATGKLNGLGSSLGGVSAFRKSGYIRRDILRIMLPIAIIIGVVTPYILVSIDSVFLQRFIGILLIVLAPTLFINKQSIAIVSKKVDQLKRWLGFILYSVILSLQSLFGTGVGSLALFVLTLLLGTSKLEADATRRSITAVMIPVSLVGLFIVGLVQLSYGLAGMAGAFIGTHIGARFAIKKGEDWSKWAMAVPIVISGIALLVS